MKYVRNYITCIALAGMMNTTAEAQVFSQYKWEQNTLISAKWSPLFYEINIGANVKSGRKSADFIYFSVGYGKPTTKNQWKHYLDTPMAPTQPTAQEQPSQPSQPSNPGQSGNNSTQSSQPGQPTQPSQPEQPTQPSQPEQPTGQEPSMDGIHAGTVGIGWHHFFNHVIGAHVQVGWGWVADFSGSGHTSNQDTTNMSDFQTPSDDGPKTFIYNTAPIQIGIEVCLWEQLVIQAGITYMWKNTPVVTVGAGFAF